MRRQALDGASPAASKYKYYFYNTVSPGLPISKHLSPHSRASTSDHGMQRRAIVRRVSAYRNREIYNPTPLTLSLSISRSLSLSVVGGSRGGGGPAGGSEKGINPLEAGSGVPISDRLRMAAPKISQ